MGTTISKPSQQELEQMHALYREGGRDRGIAPHVVYENGLCPYAECGQHLQAIDFRLEDYGPAVHDPLVRAWWNDTGFAGKCPHCGGWIHFTIRDKREISAEEADGLPKLPKGWHKTAVTL
jgi:hypothetical protein